MSDEKEFPFIDVSSDFDIEVETAECRNLQNNVNEFITHTSHLVANYLKKYDLDSKLIRDMRMIEVHIGLRNTHLEIIAEKKKRLIQDDEN